MMDLFQLLSSPDVNWWTGVVWIIVMFLSAVWSLILTAPIHCRASIAETLMQWHISTNLMKKQTHPNLGWLHFQVNYSLKPLHYYSIYPTHNHVRCRTDICGGQRSRTVRYGGDDADGVCVWWVCGADGVWLEMFGVCARSRRAVFVGRFWRWTCSWLYICSSQHTESGQLHTHLDTMHVYDSIWISGIKLLFYICELSWWFIDVAFMIVLLQVYSIGCGFMFRNVSLRDVWFGWKN